ncbi:MAG TPA: DUF378 domain-containing protein [Patescibacteria group bacterium]
MAKRKTSGGSKMKMTTVDWLAWLLVVVGAINWGLIGVANLNLVESLLGVWPVLVQIVYVLVGLSGLYVLWMAFSKK